MSGEAPALPTRAALTFAAPGRLAASLRDRPAWLDVLLLLVGLSVLSAALIPEEIYIDAFLSQAPPDAPEEAVRRQAELFFGLRWVFAVLAPPVVVAIIAGLSLFVFNVVLGGAASFRQLFALSAHAFLIPTVGALLTLPIIRATGDLESSLSLHLLVPGLDEGFFFRLLRGTSVFSLWACVVLGVGVERLYEGRTLRVAIGTYLLLYAAWKVLAAAAGGLAS